MTTTSTTPVVVVRQAGIDVGLLVLRLGIGLTMAAHGAQKLFGWFDGPGLEGTEGMVSGQGYPAPDFFAIVLGVTETFGGLALVIGLLTPLAGAAIMGTMINAVAVKWGSGYIGGIEYETVLALGGAALAFTGAGRIAVDGAIPALRHPRLTTGLGFVILGLVVAGVVLLLRN
ncbi:DoxX family protein [Nocardia higoensis]|uniref:DoxX family protein n=1 Tax=Nocardia higoensis TaxID=228599 RepID=A0ABS0DAP3_9NOCA|nr:DoxX family protein [Nocardia higoensis]MBF6354903.1 DoxX family protein [Nocardia higoensis]